MKCCGWQVVLILCLGVLAGVLHMQFAETQVAKIVQRLEMETPKIDDESPKHVPGGNGTPDNGGTGVEENGNGNGASENSTENGGGPEGNGQDQPDPGPVSFYDWGEEITADLVAQAWQSQELEAVGAIIIDARPRDKYLESHIAGAYSLSHENFRTGNLPAELNEWMEWQWPMLLYCDGGDCDDSTNLKFDLMGMGFESIYIITDGYPGLVDAGFPTVAGDTPEGDGGGG